MSDYLSNCDKRQLSVAKNLYRATRVAEAMKQVIETCRFLLREPALPAEVPRVLFTGLVCTYWRSFGDNEVVGSYRPKVPDEHKKLHESLHKLRNVFAAHTDPQALKQGDGFGANRVYLHKAGGSWTSKSATLDLPHARVLERIEALAQALHEDADREEQERLDELYTPSDWPDGEYGLDFQGGAGSPVVVKKPPLNPKGVVSEVVREVYDPHSRGATPKSDPCLAEGKPHPLPPRVEVHVSRPVL